MNYELIECRFLQMTGKPDATPYRTYLETAAAETERLLRPEYAEDPPDAVYSLAAAMAIRMWSAVQAAQERTVCTEAGTLPVSEDTAPRRAAAEALVSVYRTMCCLFLRDEAFVMMGISPWKKKKSEVKPDAEGDSSGNEGETTGGVSL